MRWGWLSCAVAGVLATGCINVNVTVPASEEVESDVQRVRRAIAEMRNAAVTLEPSRVESFLTSAGTRIAAAAVYTSCVEDDLVLINAQLVQYPNRTVRQCR